MPLTGVRPLSSRLSQPIQSARTTATIKIFAAMFGQRCVGVRAASPVARVEGRDIAVRVGGRDAAATAPWSSASGRRRVVTFSTSNSEIAESIIVPSDAEPGAGLVDATL